MAAKEGYGSLILSLDPSIESVRKATTSSTLLSALESGSYPLPSLPHEQVLIQKRETEMVRELKKAEMGFPPLLFSSHLSTLVARTYVSSHPLSGLLLHSPSIPSTVTSEHPGIFKTGLEEFTFEPNFPIGVMEDLQKEGEGDDEGEGPEMLVGEIGTEEGWKKVLEWMDRNSL